MARKRRTASTWALLGAFILLAPWVAQGTAVAAPRWSEQDLASTDRVGLTLDSGALRLDATEDLGASSRLDATVRRTGSATFPEQELEAPTDVIDVTMDTTGDQGRILTEARGGRSDGMWTEWYPLGAEEGRVVFPETVIRVQLRIEMSSFEQDADVSITGVRVRPAENFEVAKENGASAKIDDVPRPYSARLFATRIGLVGGTTANGHVVRPDDHFVALPSRRGLATRGGGEYTVRVCGTGELGPEASGETEGHTPRCAYLPVWDVGPWNIDDDHWNEERQSWRGLERGRPQAEAAYTEGYNGGLDGFGRRVRNPAGIDLADGAFEQGLRLPTNGWVQVDYLWTAQYRERAEITTATGKDPVIVRTGPGTHHDIVGSAAHKANVDVSCQVSGDSVTGPEGTSDLWYRIGEGHYVPAAFAQGGSQAPRCSTDRP